MAISVHPQSDDDKSHNRWRRRRSGWVACGLWMPVGENVAAVNVDTMLTLFAAVSACWLQQDRVLAVS